MKRNIVDNEPVIKFSEDRFGKPFYYLTRIESLESALEFAGSVKKIATLPDLVEAIIQSNSGDYVCRSLFDTFTFDYVGNSRQGNLLYIVVHGTGPLASLSRIKEALEQGQGMYSNTTYFARLSEKEFLDLSDGQYGEVQVFDFEDVKTSPSGWNSPESIVDDPFFRARIGPRVEDFIKKIKKIFGNHKWVVLNYHLKTERKEDFPIGNILHVNFFCNSCTFDPGLSLDSLGNFVGISPKPDPNERKKTTPISLGQIMDLTSLVDPIHRSEFRKKVRSFYD